MMRSDSQDRPSSAVACFAFRCQICGAGIHVPRARMPWAHRRDGDDSVGLCRRCVLQLGLTVESAEPPVTGQVVHRGWKFVRPVGCRDFIRVPVQRRRVTAAGLPARRDRHKVVLIVDDDQDVVDTLGDVLEGMGCRVAGALNGGEAMRMISRHRYDLVVLDVAMPDYNGLAVLDRLRNRDRRLGRQTPVIVITGDPDRDKQQLAEQLLVSAFLSKPFAVGQLVAHARDVLGEAV